MGIINNKWFQAVIVLVIANFFTPLGDSAVGAVGLIGMLIVFVPKFREMAKLDNIVNVNEASKQSNIKGDPKQTNGNQEAWLKMSMALWEDSEMNYPEWFAAAQEKCLNEAWEYFQSIADKVESDEKFSKKIEKEFDLSAYQKFDPREQDWIENAANAYLNREQSMQSFKNKYANK